MDAPAHRHPTDRSIASYGLGRLDPDSAAAVERHLEQCERCRRRAATASADSFLNQLRGASPSPSIAGRSDSGSTRPYDGPSDQAVPVGFAATLPPGLGDHPNYEVVRELGRGGMGVVYLAKNRLLGRHEVLKVMGRQLIDRPGLLDRFLREIRAVANLRHENIVTAYSAFEFADGLVFAMEHVDGLDLQRMIKSRGPLPVAHACHFVQQAALGLQHAHEEGLVHRDIKPGNLMLTRKKDRGIIKVLDFGLAKANREVGFDGGLTHQGQMLGTPDFIAPEQIVDAQGADIRADIYSLGCALYYMLAGKPPFTGASLYDLLQAHHSMDAQPLNLARPEVPTELAALVAKMMAKDPAHRFQTPGEVAKALAPFTKLAKPPAADSAASAPSPSPPSRSIAAPAPRSPSLAGAEVAEWAESVPSASPDSMWRSVAELDLPGASLGIDLREPEGLSSISGTSPTSPASTQKRPPWLLPAVAAGLLGIGLAVAWAAGVFKLKTKDGTIVAENVPADAEVTADRDRLTIQRPGQPPAEVTAAPDGRGVTVKQGDLETTGEQVALGSGEDRIDLRLESNPPNQGDDSGFVPLFNGKDLQNFTFPYGDDQADWTVSESGVLRGRARAGGGTSFLATKRTDLRNFRLRMVMVSDHWSKHFIFRSNLNGHDNRNYRFQSGGTGFNLGGLTINPLGWFLIRIGGTPEGGATFDETGLTVLRPHPDMPLAPNVRHAIEISAIGNEFRMIVNGQEVSACRDNLSRYREGGLEIRLLETSWIDIYKLEIQELDEGGRPLREVEEDGEQIGVDATRAPVAPGGPVGANRRGERPRATTDALQPGTVWVGSGTRDAEGEAPGSFRATFTVLERQGERFRARFQADANIRLVTGTIRGDAIGWFARDTVVEQGQANHDMKGTIRGDEITLEYSGTAATNGRPVSGTISMKRTE